MPTATSALLKIGLSTMLVGRLKMKEVSSSIKYRYPAVGTFFPVYL